MRAYTRAGAGGRGDLLKRFIELCEKIGVFFYARKEHMEFHEREDGVVAEVP